MALVPGDAAEALAAVELPRGHTVVLVLRTMAGARHLLLLRLDRP